MRIRHVEDGLSGCQCGEDGFRHVCLLSIFEAVTDVDHFVYLYASNTVHLRLKPRRARKNVGMTSA